MRYYEFIIEDLSVPDLKKEIIGQVQGMEDFKLLDRIYQVLSQTNIKQKIENALIVTTTGSGIGKIDTVINDMLMSISTLPGTSSEKLQFVESLEKGTAINIDALQLATADFSDVFDLSFAQDFFIANANFGRGRQMKGPGEFALAIMSPAISLAKKGDITINGKHIEVKAALNSTAGGRMGETGTITTSKESIISTMRKIADKYMKTPEEISFFEKAFESVISKSLTVTIVALHTLFSDDPKIITEIISAVLSLSFDGPLPKAVATAAAHDQTGRLAEQEYMRQNFEWYKKRDGFDSVMAIWFPGRKIYNFASGDEFAAMRSSGYLGSPAVSFIPSKPNEFFAQVHFTKKAW